MELCPPSVALKFFFHMMLNRLKLTPAASPTEFVDIFYDSEALLSTSDCTSRRVGFLRNRVTDTAIPMIPGIPKGLNAQKFVFNFLETALVTKCRKEREVSFNGTTTFIPNTSHRCKRRSIDIESINATDIFLLAPKEPEGLEGVTEEPRCGLSKDKEVCPRL